MAFFHGVLDVINVEIFVVDGCEPAAIRRGTIFFHNDNYALILDVASVIIVLLIVVTIVVITIVVTIVVIAFFMVNNRVFTFLTVAATTGCDKKHDW